jgi:hypothetical protein
VAALNFSMFSVSPLNFCIASQMGKNSSQKIVWKKYKNYRFPHNPFATFLVRTESYPVMASYIESVIQKVSCLLKKSQIIQK